MNTLDIQKFNPTKAELEKMADKYTSLSINGVEDAEGYKKVHEARMELKTARVKLTKFGKGLREEAVKFQKDVIAMEKDLVGIIEPLEKSLKEKQDEIDLLKEKIKRKELLPERKEALEKVGYQATDDELLEMDDSKYKEFLNAKTTEYLEEKERQQREEQERIDKEKADLEQKRLEAEREEQQKKQIEEAKARAVEEAKIRQAEQEALEEKRKADEKAKLEKAESYQKFLADNGYTEENKDQFYVANKDGKIVLFKKVAEMEWGE